MMFVVFDAPQATQYSNKYECSLQEELENTGELDVQAVPDVDLKMIKRSSKHSQNNLIHETTLRKLHAF